MQEREPASVSPFLSPVLNQVNKLYEDKAMSTVSLHMIQNMPNTNSRTHFLYYKVIQSNEAFGHR